MEIWYHDLEEFELFDFVLIKKVIERVKPAAHFENSKDIDSAEINANMFQIFSLFTIVSYQSVILQFQKISTVVSVSLRSLQLSS